MDKLDENWLRELCLLSFGLKEPKQIIVYGGYRLFIREDESAKVKEDQLVINCSLSL